MRASDGIRVSKFSKELLEAFNSGFTTSISIPDGNGVVRGISTFFRTGAECILIKLIQDYDEAILQEITGVSVVIGNKAKDSLFN